ncbi:uncharacterized protein LOC100121279 [Nasonia vitripennis]|uniref:Uncharacterized protein n=1 Tax=Nasonia vitripennis TaxID=7425 RepID=A0A7M7Q8A3_NASVI|nr:uncharacterized protein LOC100121279 [Nasonia vitripennis]
MDVEDEFFPREDDDSQARMEEIKLLKEEIKSLKEKKDKEMLTKRTIALLKTKMVKVDEILTQHNDKTKECDEKVNVAKAEKQDVLNKYNAMMEKVTRMELASIEDKQSIDKYKRLSEAQKLKLDENEKLMSQYEFKIKSLEDEKTAQSENIKTLQENVKACKAKEIEKKHTKNRACQTLRSEKRNIAVNTDFAPSEPEKPLMQDKIIMTDEVLRNEPFPIYCTKCEQLIDPAPIDQILKIMTLQPPVLSQQISAPNSPEPRKRMMKIQEPFEPIDSDWHNEDTTVQPPVFNDEPKHVNKHIMQDSKKIDESSYLQLARRVKKLESFMNKTRRNSCTNNQCCASKNINFVVKVPHEKKLNEYRKCEKRNLKKVKRLKTKPFKIDKHQHLDSNKWVVERYTGSINENAVVPAKKKKLKKRIGMHRKKGIDLLFESPEHSVDEEKLKNVRLSPLPESSPPSYRNSSLSQKSLSPSKSPSLSGVSKTNKLDVKKKLFVENVNMENSVVKSISNIDLRLSCNSLSSQVSVSKSINESIVEKDASAKNSPTNSHNLHVSAIPQEMEDNEENKYGLLPNEIEMSDHLLDAELLNKRMYNNESSCAERNIALVNKSIDDEKINKTTENLVPVLKSQENSSPQLFIQANNTGKHNKIIITEKTLNLDSLLCASNNENQIDSSISTEPRKTPCMLYETTAEDNQKKIVSSEEIEKDVLENTSITQDCTQLHRENMDGVEISELSSQHISEIEIDNSKSTLEDGTSKPIESFTNAFVTSPEKCDEMNDLINDKTAKCITYESVISTPMDCATPVEESFSNEFLLSVSPTSRDEINSIKKIPPTEMQVVKETEIMDDTLPKESAGVISTTTTTHSSLSEKYQEEVVVGQQNRLKDINSVPDKNCQSSHHLPIMLSAIGQRKKMATPAVDKFEEVPSPISDHVSRDKNVSPVVCSLESKSILSINDNSNSSNASSESKCFSVSGIKRGIIGKSRNLITSDDSSEEDYKADSPWTRKRKNLDVDSRESPITIKKVLTKIGNFRKACDDPNLLEKMIPPLPELPELPESPPTQSRPTSIQSPNSISSMRPEPSSTISVNDAELPYVPPTKQRIAHTPKTIEPISTSSEGLAVIKKTKTIKKPKAKSGDKISEILEVYDKTCKERQEINRKLNPPAPPDISLRILLSNSNPKSSLIQENTLIKQPAKKPRGRPPKNAVKTTVNTTMESSVNSDSSISEPIVKEDKQDNIDPLVRRGRPRKTPKKSNTINENSDFSLQEATVQEDEVNDTRQSVARGYTPRKFTKNASAIDKKSENSADLDLSTQKSIVENEDKVDTVLHLAARRRVTRRVSKISSDSNENLSVGKFEFNDTLPPLDTSIADEPLEEGEIDNNVLAETSDVANSTMQDETQDTESKECTRKKDVSNIIEDMDDDRTPVRELRTRSQGAPKVTAKVMAKAKPSPKNASSQQIDESNSCLRKSTIRSFLNEYLSTPKLSNRIRKNQANTKTLQNNEMICHEKLDLLINTEEWTTEQNSEVMKNLLSSLELGTIALGIVDYIAEECPEDEPLDKSNTPPAPVMPRSEQKLVTLISTINQIHAEFSEMVEKGLEYKLFRLGPPQEVQIVERLFRILVSLNKIKKDREKVRMFCCDALYCLNLRAINIIYVALMCWPEVFPKHDSNNDIIVKTIVHIVMTLQVNEPYTKLNSLRKLLSTYYEYPNSGYMTNAFRAELMQKLQENAPGINTAVLILCKKMGPNWALENFIKGLKYMIVTQTHPSLYEALTLLGNLLRSFPTKTPNKTVNETIDQLCDVLDNYQGSDDLQEGVVSCLLSISKFKYTQIARSVIDWQFDKELRSATKMKLNSFFKAHDTKWWWNFVQTHFPLPLED